jgi:hypothetical protein
MGQFILLSLASCYFLRTLATGLPPGFLYPGPTPFILSWIVCAFVVVRTFLLGNPLSFQAMPREARVLFFFSLISGVVGFFLSHQTLVIINQLFFSLLLICLYSGKQNRLTLVSPIVYLAAFISLSVFALWAQQLDVLNYVHAPLVFSYLFIGYTASIRVEDKQVFVCPRILISSISLAVGLVISISVLSRTSLLTIILASLLAILFKLLSRLSVPRTYLSLVLNRLTRSHYLFILFLLISTIIIVYGEFGLFIPNDNEVSDFVFARQDHVTGEALVELRLAAQSIFFQYLSNASASEILFGFRDQEILTSFTGLTSFHNSFLDSLSSYGILIMYFVLYLFFSVFKLLLRSLISMLNSRNSFSLNYFMYEFYSIAIPLAILFSFVSGDLFSFGVLLSPYLCAMVYLFTRSSERDPSLPGKLTPLHPDHFNHQGA